MLLSESTFEDLDYDRAAPPEAGRLEPAFEANHPSAVSSIAAVRRQIEAEIPFLRAMVRRWRRDRADAEDLVQETLLRALGSAHQWEPETSMRAWLGTIMRNQFFATLANTRRSQAAIEQIQIVEVGAPETGRA